MYFFSECRLSQKDAKLYACLISWLEACLQVRLRLPSLRTCAAQHPPTHTHTHTHTLQTQNTHTRFKHNTAETKTRTNDGGLRPHIVGSVSFCCVVFEACVLCLKCVWVLCRACAKRWKPHAHLQASPQPRD